MFAGSSPSASSTSDTVVTCKQNGLATSTRLGAPCAMTPTFCAIGVTSKPRARATCAAIMFCEATAHSGVWLCSLAQTSASAAQNSCGLPPMSTTRLGDVQPARPYMVNTRTSVSSRRSEEHTSELQSQSNLVCRLLLEKKKD